MEENSSEELLKRIESLEIEIDSYKKEVIGLSTILINQDKRLDFIEDQMSAFINSTKQMLINLFNNSTDQKK